MKAQRPPGRRPALNNLSANRADQAEHRARPDPEWVAWDCGENTAGRRFRIRPSRPRAATECHIMGSKTTSWLSAGIRHGCHQEIRGSDPQAWPCRGRCRGPSPIRNRLASTWPERPASRLLRRCQAARRSERQDESTAARPERSPTKARDGGLLPASGEQRTAVMGWSLQVGTNSG